jgi:hypothetical protein
MERLRGIEIAQFATLKILDRFHTKSYTDSYTSIQNFFENRMLWAVRFTSVGSSPAVRTTIKCYFYNYRSPVKARFLHIDIFYY